MVPWETRTRDEIPAVVGQRPGTAGPDNRFGRKRPARCHDPAAYALEERRPRHSSAPVGEWTASPLPKRRGARRNRRAPGVSPGRKHGCGERSRSEQTRFSPAGGDRQIAGCSAVNRRHRRHPSPLRLSVSICVICGQSWMAGWICADLRYLRFLLCASVSLWFSPDR
jgi:hypothetical protein